MLFAAMRLDAIGSTSRHLAAARQFGRFRTEADIGRIYVSRIERGIENPTVAILEQLARALNAHIVEFFAVPAKNEPPPKPLPGGRRRALVKR